MDNLNQFTHFQKVELLLQQEELSKGRLVLYSGRMSAYPWELGWMNRSTDPNGRDICKSSGYRRLHRGFSKFIVNDMIEIELTVGEWRVAVTIIHELHEENLPRDCKVNRQLDDRRERQRCCIVIKMTKCFRRLAVVYSLNGWRGMEESRPHHGPICKLANPMSAMLQMSA